MSVDDGSLIKEELRHPDEKITVFVQPMVNGRDTKDSTKLHWNIPESITDIILCPGSIDLKGVFTPFPSVFTSNSVRGRHYFIPKNPYCECFSELS